MTALIFLLDVQNNINILF